MDRKLKISFYSSLTFALFIIILDIYYIFIFINPNPWTSIENYINNYKFIELFPEIIGFFLLPSFLLSINGIISINDIESLEISKISRFFAAAFVITVSIVYFIQFAVIYPNIHLDNSDLYELWLFSNIKQ